MPVGCLDRHDVEGVPALVDGPARDDARRVRRHAGGRVVAAEIVLHVLDERVDQRPAGGRRAAQLELVVAGERQARLLADGLDIAGHRRRGAAAPRPDPREPARADRNSGGWNRRRDRELPRGPARASALLRQQQPTWDRASGRGRRSCAQPWRRPAQTRCSRCTTRPGRAGSPARPALTSETSSSPFSSRSRSSSLETQVTSTSTFG